MNEYNKYGEKLEEQLRLNTYPLAIRMLRSPEDIPSEAIRPLERFGKCLSTCQAFALSRRFGETVARVNARINKAVLFSTILIINCNSA